MPPFDVVKDAAPSMLTPLLRVMSAFAVADTSKLALPATVTVTLSVMSPPVLMTESEPATTVLVVAKSSAPPAFVIVALPPSVVMTARSLTWVFTLMPSAPALRVTSPLLARIRPPAPVVMPPTPSLNAPLPAASASSVMVPLPWVRRVFEPNTM